MRKIELFGSDYELLKAGVPIPPCYECKKQRKECPNCEECEQYQISMKAFDAVGIGEIDFYASFVHSEEVIDAYLEVLRNVLLKIQSIRVKDDDIKSYLTGLVCLVCFQKLN